MYTYRRGVGKNLLHHRVLLGRGELGHVHGGALLRHRGRTASGEVMRQLSKATQGGTAAIDRASSEKVTRQARKVAFSMSASFGGTPVRTVRWVRWDACPAVVWRQHQRRLGC